ncbi:MAG: hypothetical protein M0036_26360 [Desulfobacteraceae bacterium]|nr:hypothetical protein [Desulfobacteraceae bacterium]
MAPPAKGEQGLILDKVEVTIARKSLEVITTTGGDKYYLSDNTIVVGMDGNQVSIRKMLVPCDVELAYRTEAGKRWAERIDIKRVSSNASSLWISNRPE